jgi:hypothetical protein
MHYPSSGHALPIIWTCTTHHLDMHYPSSGHALDIFKKHLHIDYPFSKLTTHHLDMIYPLPKMGNKKSKMTN